MLTTLAAAVARGDPRRRCIDEIPFSSRADSDADGNGGVLAPLPPLTKAADLLTGVDGGDDSVSVVSVLIVT